VQRAQIVSIRACRQMFSLAIRSISSPIPQEHAGGEDTKRSDHRQAQSCCRGAAFALVDDY